MIWSVSCLVLLVTGSALLAHGTPVSQRGNGCGYQSCPVAQPGKLNVHLVPHTHDDVGWLKTPQQYQYGVRNNIQRAEVNLILDSVIEELQKDPSRRFIYVEMYFFFHWWDRQSTDKQDIVKKLVQSGQLEFINGGWCMNDEATPHYGPMVDQMSLGLRRLRETFGECGVPRVGWQIDPFGHSREQASQFALFGYDGMFFARADYQDIDQRRSNKTLEMVWHGNEYLGEAADILTHIMAPASYGPPPGMCWDTNCDDDPIVDDPDSEENNVDKITKFFDNYLTNFRTFYQTNNVMIPFGSDFQYQVASRYYNSLDKLIKYMNQKYPNYNLFYSTPSCYLKVLNEANMIWPEKKDDFFPYGNDPHSYWTGYFTSRPAFKHYERVSNNVLLASKQLATLARFGLDDQIAPNLTARQVLYTHADAQGVAQHHDAVSGTAKQHVTDDYAKLLFKGQVESEILIGKALEKLIPVAGGKTQAPVQFFCHDTNETSCSALKDLDYFTVTLYNPLLRERNYTARVTVPNGPDTVVYTVKNGDGTVLFSNHIAAYKKANGTYELSWVVQLPALGFATYFVAKSPAISQNKQYTVVNSADAFQRGLTLKTPSMAVIFDSNGAVKGFRSGSDTKPFTQAFKYYEGYNGRNANQSDRASGAYIFRPNGTTPYSVADGDKPRKSQFVLDRNGKVIEVWQEWNDWISQVVRVDPVDNVVEFEYQIGPIPVGDNIGKEVITQYTSQLKSNGTFYTDANGRQTVKRVRNYQESFKTAITEPVSQNYYPVNARISLFDEDASVQNPSGLLVLTDRSHGGSSMNDGQLEVMLHRRLLWDDAFGVGEPLNEPGKDGKGLVVRGKHRVVFAAKPEVGAIQRDLANKYWQTPLETFAEFDGDIIKYAQQFNVKFSNLTQAVPDNVNLLALEPVNNPLDERSDAARTVLLRLEHFYDPSDAPSSPLSKTVQFDVCALLGDMASWSLTETVLGGNEPLASVQRLKWRTTSGGEQENLDGWDYAHSVKRLSDCNLQLDPMQIRTFLVSFKN